MYQLPDPETCQSLHSLMEMSLSKLILILPLWALLSNVICKEKEEGSKTYLIVFEAKVPPCINQETILLVREETQRLIPALLLTLFNLGKFTLFLCKMKGLNYIFYRELSVSKILCCQDSITMETSKTRELPPPSHSKYLQMPS